MYHSYARQTTSSITKAEGRTKTAPSAYHREDTVWNLSLTKLTDFLRQKIQHYLGEWQSTVYKTDQ